MYHGYILHSCLQPGLRDDCDHESHSKFARMTEWVLHKCENECSKLDRVQHEDSLEGDRTIERRVEMYVFFVYHLSLPGGLFRSLRIEIPTICDFTGIHRSFFLLVPAAHSLLLRPSTRPSEKQRVGSEGELHEAFF